MGRKMTGGEGSFRGGLLRLSMMCVRFLDGRTRRDVGGVGLHVSSASTDGNSTKGVQRMRTMKKRQKSPSNHLALGAKKQNDGWLRLRTCHKAEAERGGDHEGTGEAEDGGETVGRRSPSGRMDQYGLTSPTRGQLKSSTESQKLTGTFSESWCFRNVRCRT